MKNYLTKLGTAMFLFSALFIGVACGDDDEDEKTEYKPGKENKITKTKLDIKADASFTPDESYIQKTWGGEYQGWDAVQEKNTTIRRQLTLKANGTYTNVIAGKLIDTDKTKFFKFESEAGDYKYSAGTITYTPKVDSVLNYREQTYNVYKAKHFKNSEKSSYTEKAEFSEMKEGKRVWITKDTYLQSLTDEVLELVFSMSEYAGEKNGDQNKN